jgi:hypothetical protein
MGIFISILIFVFMWAGSLCRVFSFMLLFIKSFFLDLDTIFHGRGNSLHEEYKFGGPQTEISRKA